MSKAGAQQNDIEKLLAEIDGAVSIEDMGKEARLTDARNTINLVRADLIGLKRMLIQHPNPNQPIQELNGQTLGSAIRDKIKQAARLEAYIKKLEELPDDPPAEDEDVAKANGHEGLRADELHGRLEEEEATIDD